MQPGTQAQLLYRVRHGYVRWRKLPTTLPFVLIDLIRGLLDVDPRHRYGALQLARHPFLLGEARQPDRMFKGTPEEVLQLFSEKSPLAQPDESVLRDFDASGTHVDDRRAIYTIERVRTRLRSGLQPTISREMQAVLGTVEEVQLGAARDLEIVDRRDRVKAALQVGADAGSGAGSSGGKNSSGSMHSAGDGKQKKGESIGIDVDGRERDKVGALRSVSSTRSSNDVDASMRRSKPDRMAAVFQQHRIKTVGKQAQVLQQRRMGLPSAVDDDFEGAGSDSISVQDFPDGQEQISREDAFIMAVAEEEEERRDRRKKRDSRHDVSLRRPTTRGWTGG